MLRLLKLWYNIVNYNRLSQVALSMCLLSHIWNYRFKTCNRVWAFEAPLLGDVLWFGLCFKTCNRVWAFEA